MKNDPVLSPGFKNNPALFAFLPILYIVWADLIITPSELKQIRKIIEELDWLSDEDKTLLISYFDPGSAPTPDQLKGWLNEIQRLSDQISPETKDSLVEIGIKLSSINSTDVLDESMTQSINTLVRIEEALGVISRESAFNFFLSTRRKTKTGKDLTRKTFDTDIMAALLDGKNSELIQKVKTLLSNPFFRYTDPGNSEEYRDKVLEWCQELAKQGYGSIAYPEAYGGKNDMEAYFALFETLSSHDLSMVIKFGVQFGLFGMSINFLGTQKHHEKYLRQVGTLELPGCFAMTETGHGSNVREIETTATYDHEEKTFVIHTPHDEAQKDYIGNAACHGQMATVFAKLILEEKDYGVNAFLVPIRDKKGNVLKGVSIRDCGRKMGLNGVDNGRIQFDKVVIPKENMLNKFADITEDGEFTSPISSDNRRFFTMLGTLVGGRIGIPRAALSAAKSGLTIAIKYACKRKQFGPEGGSEVSILNYRTHQRRLMPLLANAYGLHFSLQYLTQRYMQKTEEDMQEIEAIAAGLKSFTTWNTSATLQECRECCGGAGYLSENRLDRLKNDTEIFTTFEGDNTVLMQLVAKSRLVEFKQDFANINFFGVLNYLGNQARTTLQEMNPIIIRNTDTEHLLDPEFHLNAFQYRERDILTSAAKRLKKHIDEGMDSFDAFNQCQHHLGNVGNAYIERLILEQFQTKVDEVDNPHCKEILDTLCSLFALSMIEKNKGWYLEHGYMEGIKTKAIRKLVDQLCFEIRQEALQLVESFKIPNACLSAPIAMN